MLPGHLGDTHVCSNDYHRVVRHQTHKTEHGRFQVLLVAAQVQERDQMLRVLGDMGPRLILVGVHVLHLDLIVFFVEAHDLLPDTGRPAICGLVAEVEHLLTGGPTAVVHDTLGQYSHHGTLTRVYIANNGNPDIIRVAFRRRHIVAGRLELGRRLDLAYLGGLFLRHKSHLRRRHSTIVILTIALGWHLLLFLAISRCSLVGVLASLLLLWRFFVLLLLSRLLNAFLGQCPGLSREPGMLLLNALEHLIQALLLHATAATASATPSPGAGGTPPASPATTPAPSGGALVLACSAGVG